MATSRTNGFVLRPIAAIALAAVAAGARPALADERSIVRSAPARGVRVIKLQLDAGNITFVAQRDSSALRLEARVSGSAEPHISLRRNGDTLSIGIESPRTAGLPFAAHGSVRYELDYPAAIALQAHAQTGNIDASGSLAGLAIETEAGNIAVTAAHGDVDVLTDAGNCTVRLAPDWRPSPVRLQAGTGNVTLEVPAAFHARIDASSGLGNVTNTAGSAHVRLPVAFLFTRVGNVTVRRY